MGETELRLRISVMRYDELVRSLSFSTRLEVFAPISEDDDSRVAFHSARRV